MHLEIIDFGTSMYLIKSEAKLTGMSLNYAAPEQFNDDILSTKTDIWAVGGIIYRIFSG